jgi:hypothetical protein
VFNDTTTMTAAVNPTGRPTALKYDAFYCGNTKAGIDWTPLTGHKDKPLHDKCHEVRKVPHSVTSSLKPPAPPFCFLNSNAA